MFGMRNVPRFRRWEKLLDSIEYTETMDRQAQIEFVEKQLKETIRHAVEKVPFYRKFASLAPELESRSAFDVLKEFPVIDKDGDYWRSVSLLR